MSSFSSDERTPTQLPRRVVGAVAPGTLLNPLNSSMIAVAILSLRSDFRVNTATATWLISGFYLAAAIGMPLMGRLADLFGPRRIFMIGLVLVGVTGALAPFAPGFGWLLALRVVQAFGSSAPYPAGLAIFRSLDPRGRTPANALGALAIAASVSAALGPVLGGVLVAVAGWRAIFLVNVPIIAVGLVLAARWLPPDRRQGAAVARSSPRAMARAALRVIDLPGIVLFGTLLICLLGFLLSLSGGPLWPLAPAALVAAVLLLARERGVERPFLDVRLLAANRPLTTVYAQFAAVNVVFYAFFFSLPLWLQQARGFDSGVAGLLLLPLAGVGVLVTPLAARLITRYGPRPSLLIGAAMLLVGSLALLAVDAGTPVIALVLLSAILGVPNGFNNLGLQSALYENAPADKMGAAGGLFQTCRYLGAILATALLGLVFGATASSGGLHTIAAIIGAVSALLLAASAVTGRAARTGQRT